MPPEKWAILVLIIIAFYIIGKISGSVFVNGIFMVLLIGLIIYIVFIFLLELLRDVISGAD